MGIGLTHFLELKPDTAPTWPEFAADCRTRHHQKEMKMEWIKTSERLPELGQAVLVVWERNIQKITYELIHCDNTNELRWFPHNNSDHDSADLGEFEHWMPLSVLPQPPEE